MDEPSLAGRLLVAAPMLREPAFDRTVVLVLEHGDGGTLGVVLNRPSEIDLGEPLPGWERLAAAPPVLFLGGPVAPSGALCLGRHTAGAAPDGWRPLFDGLAMVDLDVDADRSGAAPGCLRVFIGHAGWAPGQLAGELQAGAWFVVDSLPGDALSPEPEGLWPLVLRRQGGALAMVASFPADPAMN